MDLAFAVDSSGSVNDANPINWNNSLALIVAITRRFVIGVNQTRVGLVRFTDIANVIFNLNTYYIRYSTYIPRLIVCLAYLADYLDRPDLTYSFTSECAYGIQLNRYEDSRMIKKLHNWWEHQQG